MPADSTRFVIVSGLPGSGKSTLAHRIALLLSLPVIDKDDLLERLFESKGTGDASWRRRLSRESDRIFQTEAANSPGAVLVSFWHVPGMPESSGTCTDWLTNLSPKLLHVHCVCPPELAAQRFHTRQRHPGHGDHTRSFAQLLESLQELDRLGAPALAPRVDVNTSHPFGNNEIAREIPTSFSLLT